jgi:Glycosyl hydrolase catalytic core
VWITEFACTSWDPSYPVSQEEISDFFHEATQKLDRIDWIERYAWFGAARRPDPALGSGICLIDPHGKLSQLGIRYMNGYSTKRSST